MTEQIRLSPYNLNKTSRFIINGASSIRVGFIPFQWINELDPSKGAVIINANSSMLKKNQLQFSPLSLTASIFTLPLHAVLIG